MVNGADDASTSSAAAGSSRPERRLRRRGGAAQRDRADPGAARAAGRRAQPDGRRPARRRLAGQRRDPAAGDRRPSALDPPLRRAAARAPASWSSSGTLTAAQLESLEAAVAGRRSVLVSGGTGSGKTTLLNALSSFIGAGRAGGDDRGRGRAAAAAASRGAAGEPAGGRRGQGRGDDPRPAAQRAADATRPDRDRRGARRRGARPAHGAQHRPRRRSLDRPRQLAGRRAQPAGDAGADGRASGCRTRRSPSRCGAGSTSSSTSSAGPTAPGGSPRSPRSSRVSGLGLPPYRCSASPPRRAGCVALAAREAVLASPAAARWLQAALEPLRRAGREGYAPSSPRAPPPRRARRRSPRCSAAGSSPAPAVALPLAVAGPALAAWAISSRRAPLPGAVERSLPDVATRSPTRSPPAARCAPRCRAAAASLDGPPAVELARLGAELELGAPTAEAIEGWRRRMRSARVDAFAAALLSQRLAGGDLAGLLRRFAERCRRARPGRRGRQVGDRPGSLHRPARGRDADRRRALRRADRSRASSPSCSARPASAVLLVLAAALQLAGFVAIRRLSQVAE